jgi:ubiquinone/menaquinone biosynthesis C-methylase UbiE
VLDAGIGTGELTAALAHHRSDANWHGIDISDAMLETAAQRLNLHGDFRQANLADLPYDDNSFDLVISAHALEHMPDPEVGMRELLRVLKPGQPFVIVATRLCPITTVLSLRWNFRPMRTGFVSRELENAGGTDVSVVSLMPQRNMAYMSLVYSGVKAVIG